MIPPTLPGEASIDLHLHTVYSDGHWEPAALFDSLAGDGFRLVAITDHDRVDHLAELAALGAERGVAVVPGVEVTASWHGRIAHLLCYAGRGHPPDAPTYDHAVRPVDALMTDVPTLPPDGALARLTAVTVAHVRENTAAVTADLERQGSAFPRRAEVRHDERDPLARPASNARLLLAHGYETTMAEALALIAAAGYHIISAPLAEAIAAAHSDGALALLAHPGRQDAEIPRYPPDLLARVCDELPLDGLEAYYPLHSPEQTAAYLAFARERELLVSAGSDSHGPRQRLPIPNPARDVAALLERVGITVTE